MGSATGASETKDHLKLLGSSKQTTRTSSTSKKSQTTQIHFQNSQFISAMGDYKGEVRKLASKMMVVMNEKLGLPKAYIKKAFIRYSIPYYKITYSI